MTKRIQRRKQLHSHGIAGLRPMDLVNDFAVAGWYSAEIQHLTHFRWHVMLA